MKKLILLLLLLPACKKDFKCQTCNRSTWRVEYHYIGGDWQFYYQWHDATKDTTFQVCSENELTVVEGTFPKSELTANGIKAVIETRCNCN